MTPHAALTEHYASIAGLSQQDAEHLAAKELAAAEWYNTDRRIIASLSQYPQWVEAWRVFAAVDVCGNVRWARTRFNCQNRVWWANRQVRKSTEAI